MIEARHLSKFYSRGLYALRDLSLAEIALSAGFANQSHFTRVFSAVVGVSPGAWRRETEGAAAGETWLLP